LDSVGCLDLTRSKRLDPSAYYTCKTDLTAEPHKLPNISFSSTAPIQILDGRVTVNLPIINSHFGIIEYAGHARDYVKTIELADWSGIVLASGDGLVYEVNTFIFYIQFFK